MSRSVVHIVIASLVLLGFIFLNFTAALPWVFDFGRKGVAFLDTPLVVVFTHFKNFFQVVGSIKELNSQNIILETQVQVLTADLAGLEKMSEENRILREALSFEKQSSFDLLPAEVLSRDALEGEQKVTLSRGSRDGAARGQAVVVAGKIMVGVISEVSERTSEMELITSSEIAINAEDATSGAMGLIRGEHGLGLLFDLISQDDQVSAGDQLLTSGLGGTFPRNLLVGKVSDTRRESSELFQTASVIPAADLRSLRFVFIIK